MKNEGALDWAPRGFVDTIVTLSLQSLEMRNTIAPRCKADGTLVTDADTGLEDRLAEFLLGAEPGSFLIGEETLSTKGHDYLSKALKGKTWVIDPIDGTVLYCMGMDGWGISVGLLENGCMRHGAVAYPKAVPGGAVIGLLASSGEDSVVYGEISVAEGADPRKASADLVAALAPVRRIPPVDGYPGLLAVSQRVAKAAYYDGPHQIMTTASCVASFFHLIHGGFVGYLVRLKLWDMAAVWPIAIRIGVKASYSVDKSFGAELDEKIFELDPSSPQFLSLREHVLFYAMEGLDKKVWDHLSWAKKA